MAGLAELGCPGGLTFQVEPGATLQRNEMVTGPILNGDVQVFQQRASACKAKPLPLPPLLLIIVNSLPLSCVSGSALRNSRYLSSIQSRPRYIDLCLQSPHSLRTNNVPRRILCDFKTKQAVPPLAVTTNTTEADTTVVSGNQQKRIVVGNKQREG